MKVDEIGLPGVLAITPRRFGDDRGFFSETYNRKAFAEAGVDVEFIQDNHSMSAEVGTVRGLHFQAPPFAQAKLVRVVRGRIYDVAVDSRVGSPSFGKHAGLELTASGGEQLFVPAGFLHGFITLEPNTEVVYKVDNHYSRDHDGAVRFDDPDLEIDWGPHAANTVLSDKDATAQSWRAFSSPFDYSRAVR
ncbi:dTDP-4-dehydrorhamnose 3,5-epimerase [Maricaulis sp.]|uniref:dTDP-4-dehydrorhamnose 3,5-epimerase n=1 Tax=Maricaulis sp. TaxID=1486257 RepID=UPI00260FA1C2|nr:dTDP-4-dehydrorhamnose 3,5-epimerase [Maricaulis sp.]MDF1769360.1 dTDP-4-dehydrorhamnose 3,5-epimerase [Maricaulis sp.]